MCSCRQTQWQNGGDLSPLGLVPSPKICHHISMSTRYFYWGLLVCVALGFNRGSMAEEPAGVSEEAYSDLMTNEVLDVQDLAEGAEIQRRMFNRITPSGFSWLQPMFPSVVPFDAKYFDEAFLDGLLGEDANSVAVYPLSLVLDPKTRETLIYNADGELIASAPSDGVSRTWPEDADPSRVTLLLDLLPAEDAEQYLYTEDRIADTLASYSAKPAKSSGADGVVMLDMMVGNTNFGIWDIQHLTNGNFRLTVTNGTDVAEVFSYTVWHTSSVVVATWTNEESNAITSTNLIWTPTSPPFNGLESDWDVGTTNLVLTNGGGTWEDSDISTNARVRFYGAAERADSDWDGLSDGEELFVYHTCPTNRDTDGDGWSDAEELTEETDPLDRFSATHLAKGVLIHGVCYNPSNGLTSSNQWVQLHSSSASPVNLGDFRLQVAGSNYATKLSFPSNTWIQPGHFILVGGSNVAGSDYLASLDLPNSYSTNPTAGARLVGPDGVDADPADVVMYGTHSPFNEGGLPTNGWASTNTDLWAGRSNQLVRTRLGQDADLRSDWTYRLVGDLWNSEIVLDTDGDGLTDGEEYSGSEANGVQSDPLDPDTDNDGLEDGFEADHGLNPANSDSDGDSILDRDEINPETGNTYLEDQLGTDVSVSIDSSLPGWILGQSIGSNGWVKFTCESWEGVGVWATIKEGGDAPEDFTCMVTNATVAYSNDIINGGFRTLQLLLISTNHAVPIEVTVNDGGTYWTNQTPITLGPDIFAHFDAVKVTLDALSFSGTNYHYVISDDGLTAYSEPQWITSGPGEAGRSYPLCYVRGSKMAVLGGWDITPAGLPADLSVQIQGTASGGMGFPWTQLTRSEDVRWVSPVMECSNAFDAVVAFFNPMQIDWSVLLGSCTVPLNAGMSTNQCYVTLDDPLNADLRHTVLHLGCMNAAGNAVTQAVVDAIYGEFSDQTVVRVSDDRQMTYWADVDEDGESDMGAVDANGLLSSADANGNCNAWSSIFRDCLQAQGITADLIRVLPVSTNDGFIMVKNWQFDSTPSGTGTYNYILGTDVWRLAGISAQGNTNPPAIFETHWITSFNEQYYNPSYGSPKISGTNKDKYYEDSYFDGYMNYEGDAARTNNTSSGSTSEVDYQIY